MIKVTRLGSKGGEYAINAELIEHVEATPDTVITLTTGNKLLVQESLDEVIQRVIEYRRQISAARPARAGGSRAPRSRSGKSQPAKDPGGNE